MNRGVLPLPAQYAAGICDLAVGTFAADIDSGVHPEAAGWAQRVRNNNGSVSRTTLNLVSQFCRFVEQNNIRELFYRLNLFCGDNLQAALVPLFCGPNSSFVFGNATDTNLNFVSGDYSESTGMNPGASNANKHLRTGLSPNAMGNSDGHLSAYIHMPNSMAATQYHVISVLNTSQERYFLFGNRTSTAYNPGEMCSWGLNVNVVIGPGTFTGGHIIFSQNSAAGQSLAVVNGGTKITAGVSTRSPLTCPRDFYVFAVNNGGSPLFYLNQVLRAYSIGRAMTAQQADVYYAAMNAFQTALGRSV